MPNLRQIMHPNPQVVKPTDTLLDASKIMAERNIGYLPVLDNNGKIVGTLTDRDIVITGIAKQKDLKTPINEVMTKNPVTVDVQSSIENVVKLMKDKNIRRLLVTEGDKLTGILTLGDLSCACHGKEQEKLVMEALYKVSSSERSGVTV